jgi:histidinol-phosphate aminotransferase
MSMLARVRPDLASFRAYVSARSSGLDAPIRLNANESPWPGHGASGDCNRYPDPQPAALRARLAELYGIDASQIWMGRGSDEAIDLLMRAFCRAGRDNIVTLAPTFGMYATGARLQGAECRELALDADSDFALDAERLLALTDAYTKLVIVCSPNNPTGTLYHDALAFLADRLRGRALLVVDEAYLEFAGIASAAGLIGRYDNVAVLRTLSKAHALAGARIGALVAHADVAAFMGRIAAPYPLPAPCVTLALQALEPSALRETGARVAQLLYERERVTLALAPIQFVVRIWPSRANFLLVRFTHARVALERALAAGIVVRDVSAQAGLDQCLRITIGAAEENDTLLDALSGRLGAPSIACGPTAERPAAAAGAVALAGDAA